MDRQRRVLLAVGAAALLLLGATVAWQVLLPRQPLDTSIAAVVAGTGRWRGVRVRVTGRLLAFHDAAHGTYGVIRGRKQDGIGIRRLAPWAALVGRAVVAVGTVRFDPSFGFYLADPSLHAVPGT